MADQVDRCAGCTLSTLPCRHGEIATGLLRMFAQGCVLKGKSRVLAHSPRPQARHHRGNAARIPAGLLPDKEIHWFRPGHDGLRSGADMTYHPLAAARSEMCRVLHYLLHCRALQLMQIMHNKEITSCYRRLSLKEDSTLSANRRGNEPGAKRVVGRHVGSDHF